MVVGMSLCVIQKPFGSRVNKQKEKIFSRNSLEWGGAFEWSCCRSAGGPEHHRKRNLGFFGKSLDRRGTSGNPTHTSSACLGVEPRPPAGDGPFVAEI